MAKISYILLGLLIGYVLTPSSFARDPKIAAGLKNGQPYDFARKRLLRLGYRVTPTNIALENFEADKNQPEITCGYLKDSAVPKTVCAVSFENRRGDYISLELKKTRWGYVLAEL